MAVKKIELHGIIKHANVCRVLCRNDITAYEFYIIARVCSENLPPATFTMLQQEMCIIRRGQPNSRMTNYLTTRARVLSLMRRGLVQIRREKRDTVVEPTLPGWKFFILTLAEMERPIRDFTIFDSPKKLQWQRAKRKFGKKETAARKAFSIVKAAKPIGLSIWQRCGVASIPPFQRLRMRRKDCIAPKSSEPDSTVLQSQKTSPS